MKKLMKRSLIARLLATVAVTGLIALYLLNVISTGAFVPLIVIVFLLFWSFGVKRESHKPPNGFVVTGCQYENEKTDMRYGSRVYRNASGVVWVKTP